MEQELIARVTKEVVARAETRIQAYMTLMVASVSSRVVEEVNNKFGHMLDDVFEKRYQAAINVQLQQTMEDYFRRLSLTEGRFLSLLDEMEVMKGKLEDATNDVRMLPSRIAELEGRMDELLGRNVCSRLSTAVSRKE